MLGDEVCESGAREKKYMGFGDCLGICGEALAREYGNLPEWFARSQDVENLFLSFDGKLIDLYKTLADNVKTIAFFSFKEHRISLLEIFFYGDLADPVSFLFIEALKKERVRDDFLLSHCNASQIRKTIY